jgi:hypothetical protein
VIAASDPGGFTGIGSDTWPGESGNGHAADFEEVAARQAMGEKVITRFHNIVAFGLLAFTTDASRLSSGKIEAGELTGRPSIL